MRIPQPVRQFQTLQSPQNNKRTKGSFGRKRNRRKDSSERIPDTVSTTTLQDTVAETQPLTPELEEGRKLATRCADLRICQDEINEQLQEWQQNTGISEIGLGDRGKVVIVEEKAAYVLNREKLGKVLREQPGMSPARAQNIVDQGSKPVMQRGYLRFVRGKNAGGDETEN